MRDIKKFIPWLGDHKKLLLGVCTAFVCLNPSNTSGHSDFAGSGRMSLRRCFLGSGKRLFLKLYRNLHRLCLGISAGEKSRAGVCDQGDWRQILFKVLQIPVKRKSI